MDIISSSNNQYIKYLKKLYKTRQRKKEGKFLLEGIRIIEEAFDSGADIETIFLIPELKDKPSVQKLIKNCSVKYVEKKLIFEIASTVNPQGIVAVIDKPDLNFKKISDKKNILVLDRIQDPGNMGTLIRTAVGAGFDGVIALKGCVDIYNLKVLKATMGAVFEIPIITRMGVDLFLKKYNSSKFNLYVTAIEAETNYFDINYEEPFFMVIGNEAAGIREEILEIADFQLKIPLLGEIDSLNAAVSGAVIMYEYVSKKINS